MSSCNAHSCWEDHVSHGCLVNVIVFTDPDSFKQCAVCGQNFMQNQIIASDTFWWSHGCELLSQFANFKICLMI